MKEIVSQTVSGILKICQPDKIFLYAEKRTMTTGELKSFSLCLVVPNGTDCRALRTRIYLDVVADIAYSLKIYTVDEWNELFAVNTSYAAWIARKGQVVYVKTA